MQPLRLSARDIGEWPHICQPRNSFRVITYRFLALKAPVYLRWRNPLLQIRHFVTRDTAVSALDRQSHQVHSVASAKRGFVMTTRHLLTAALLSLSAIALPESTRTANAADPLAYCKSDVARLCPGVTPGGGKVIGCLKEHQNEISVGCAKALQAIKTKMGK